MSEEIGADITIRKSKLQSVKEQAFLNIYQESLMAKLHASGMVDILKELKGWDAYEMEYISLVRFNAVEEDCLRLEALKAKL